LNQRFDEGLSHLIDHVTSIAARGQVPPSEVAEDR